MHIQTVSDLFANKKKSIKYLSLDIFDTVLVRTYSKPTELFYDVWGELNSIGAFKKRIDKFFFHDIRIKAEKASRKDFAKKNSEVNLRQIYEKLCDSYKNLFKDFVDIDLLIKQEEKIEKKALKLNKPFLEKLKISIDYDYLIFVSDMYLDHEFIEKILKESGVKNILGDYKALYVSNKYREGKGTGLFKTVINDLGVEPNQIIHIGDNIHADYYSSIKNGINAFYYDISIPYFDRVLRNERKICDEFRSFNPQLFKTIDFGLTAVRKRAYVKNEDLNVNHFNYGATVLGPLLATYIDWVVNEVVKNGASKIFSFTRESHLFNQLLKDKCKIKNIDLEILEIKVSRSFLKSINIDFSSHQSLINHFRRRNNPSVFQILNDFGLSKEDSKILGVFDLNLDEILSNQDFNDCLQKFLKSEKLLDKAKLHISKQKEFYLDYLEKIGFTDDNVYITDLGFGGTIQKLLQEFIDSNRKKTNTYIHGLYFITVKRINELNYQKNSFKGFLCDKGNPVYLRNVFMRTPEIMEQSCMPDYGSFKGFDDAGVFQLFDQGISQKQCLEIKKIQKGIIHFNNLWNEMDLQKEYTFFEFNYLLGYLRSILIRSLRNPLVEDVHLFSGWFHDNNDGSNICDPFLGKKDIINKAKRMSLRKIKSISWHECFWPNGLYVFTHNKTIGYKLISVNTVKKLIYKIKHYVKGKKYRIKLL